MLSTVILGAGPAGAATALFLARRGHDVTILDRDPQPVEMEQWKRSRVPHARQGHSFLALGTQVLGQEAPDLVERLLAAGALRVALPHDPDCWNLLSRRQLFDAVLRVGLSTEPRVRLLPATLATGLLVQRTSSGPPQVVGVRTSEDEIRADVVIDACGCHSPVPRWLAAHDISLQTFSDGSHFFYLTRHYRLRASHAFPTIRVPVVATLDYTSVLAFPEDNGHFQLTVQLARTDPTSRALRETATFERFLAEVPLMAPWLDAGEPIGAPEVFATVGNGRRQTCSDRPLVTGLLLVGDTAFHTNPSAARGVALGLTHAQALANLLHDASDGPYDPAALTERWEQTTSTLLDPYVESQVRIDRQRLVQIRCSLEGRQWDADSDTHRLAQALMDYRDCDVVGAAADRLLNLLVTPQELYANGDVMRRILKRIRSSTATPTPLGPSRREYERLVGGMTHAAG